MRVDAFEFLDRLGVENLDPRGDEVYYSCPFPGHAHGDASRSASMNVDTGSFHCFGCGRSGNMVTFLSELEGVPPHRARRLIAEAFAKEYEEPQGSFASHLRKTMNRRSEELERLPPPTEEHLRDTLIDWGAAFRQSFMSSNPKDHDPFTDYVFGRGFLPDVLEVHELGQDPVTGALTIPYRDSAGDLVGFKARAWAEGQGPRYRVLGGKRHGFSTFELSNHLFGVHLIAKSGELIVVEGELNCVAMRQYGHDRVVGLSGKKLSLKQMDIVCSIGDSAVLLFDDVEDAEWAAHRLDKRIPVRIVGEHDRDPADSSDEEVAKLLDAALPSGRRF